MNSLLLERTSSALLNEREQPRAEQAVQARANETNATQLQPILRALEKVTESSIEWSLAAFAVASIEQSWSFDSARVALSRTFGARTSFDAFPEAMVPREPDVIDEATLSEVRKEARLAVVEGLAPLTTELDRFRSASARIKELADAMKKRRGESGGGEP